MSDTPQTDRQARCKSHGIVDADFARQLERELTEAKQVRPTRGDVKLLEQQLAEAKAELAEALKLLAEWCVAVEDRGTGWDDWDEHYKDANYRPGPLRELIDAKKAEVREDGK